MSSPKLHRVLALFDSIVDLPLAAQAPALRSAADDDEALFQAVWKMLEADRNEQDLFHEVAVSSSVLRPGQLLGRYRVEHMLGRGGMAEVWQVRHQLLDSRHALKVLVRTSAQLRSRLLQEGRVQARLEHPNVLPVRDVLTVGGRLGLLMPLIAGPSLEALMRHHHPTTDTALSLLAGITEGLAFAHAHGFVHRDIKPANVLLDTRQGVLQPRLADFGLVKEQDLLQTQTGQVFGTPAYAAPEQLADASQADARADIFSLGVLMVELLTGRRPFQGSNLAQLLDAHRSPPALAGMPPALRDLAAAMLQRDPAARPASCAVVRAALPEAPEPVRIVGPIEAAIRQVSAEATASATSAVASAAAPPADTWSAPLEPPDALPQFDDVFLGREREREELAALVQEHRLVTVLGMGGIGKTRLAASTGTAQRSAWPGGVWFCDLSEAENGSDVLSAIGQMMHVPLTRTPARQLGDVLRARGRALFILDNFEQVADTAPDTVGAWLEQAPDAHFLVTSRVPLRLRGEQSFSLDVLDESDAFELFEARARLADHRFAASADNRTAITELVRLLDRLPLAIELAAARTRMLPPRRMLARMARRFELLKSRSAELPPRQRTLRATLEWSWNLLQPAEQSALAQLSVFEGGFTLEAAEAVVVTESDWVEDLLAELLDKSLLTKKSRAHDRHTRLGMLVSVHQFARQQLSEPLPAEQRHGAYFAALPAPRTLSGAARLDEERRQSDDLENLRAASQRAIQRNDPATATPCVLKAVGVLLKQGPISDGCLLLEQAMSAPSLTDHQRMSLQSDLTRFYRLLGRPAEALQHAEATRALAEALGEPQTIARNWCSTGNIYRHTGDIAKAQEAYERSLVLAEAQGDTDLLAMLWGNLGALSAMRGQRNRATEQTRNAIKLLQNSQDPRKETSWLINLATLLRTTQPDEAIRLYERVLTITRAHGNRYDEGCALGGLANHCTHYDRHEEALSYFQQALVASREVGDRKHEGYWLVNLGHLHEQRGDYALAEATFREAMAHAPQQGRRLEANTHFMLGLVLSMQGRWAEADPLLSSGEAMLTALQDQAQLVHLLDRRAQIELKHQRTAQARVTLARARAHAEELQDASAAELHALLDETAKKLGR